MAKLSVLITLLLPVLFNVLLVVSEQSSCSEYFTYVTNNVTNEIMGQIQIPFPPKNVELRLNVSLSIGASVTKRFMLRLAQSREDSIRDIQEDKPLIYHIHFPRDQQIPILNGIWFNEQEYCTGPRAIGPFVTIMLEHVLYVPLLISFSSTSTPKVSTQQNPLDYTLQSFPTIPTMPTNPTTTRSNTEATIQIASTDRNGNDIFLDSITQNVSIDCGRRDVNDSLPSRGEEISPGDWPWLVALFSVYSTGWYNNIQYECAGSILTHRHVITTAGCLWFDEHIDNRINTLLISLGRYDLNNRYEADSVNRDLERYIIHPDYIPGVTADFNLAILILKTPVEFGPTIKPICLWTGPIDLVNIVGKTGYVVGWNRNAFHVSHSVYPQMATMPIVSQTRCLRSSPDFAKITSTRTFCAGSRDGNDPCFGNIGSGFIIYDSTTGHYYLRGITSQVQREQNDVGCIVTEYFIFVDVAKYVDWINEQISTT